jgi:hypothetical protein
MTELRFAGDLPLWVVISLALGLSLLAFLLYRRELRTGAMGWLLPTMRALAVLLIVLMLAGPELVHTTGEEQRGRVVLLVDRSASMGVSDPQLSESQRKKSAEALGVDEAEFEQMPRLERAERIVLDLDKGLLSKLRADHAVDIVELRGGKPELVWSSSEDATPPDNLVDAEPGSATDLGGYIARALDDAEDTAGGRLAFALLTDGRHNQGEPLGEVAVRARAAGVPVHAIAIGARDAPPDLAVVGVDHPPSVFPDDRVSGQITLLDGMQPGQAFTLEVVAGDTVLWSSRQVTVGGAQQRAIGFDFPAEQAIALAKEQTPEGLRQNQLPLALTARITGLDDDTETRNDAMAFQVRAVTGQRKMLILAGRARWEMRYLDAMFTRDPRWEVTTLMGGPGVGRRWARADSGEAFPDSREGLFAYDVVVLGELPAGTLSDGELEWLYAFVANRAGGLIVIDGRRGAFASYGKSPIAPLLPERIDGPPLRPTQFVLTDAGKRHPTLRLEPDSDLNTRTWSRLPPPGFVAPVKPRSGVDEVLVEVSVGRGNEQTLPAVLTRRVGAGWVWYSAVDESWRWRRDVESLYQNRYWHQVTNRVVEPLYAAEDKYVSLGVDDAVVDSGGEIPVRVRLRDDAGRPRPSATARVYLETLDGERVVRSPLTADAVEGGRFTTELDASVAPGVYRVGVEVDGVSSADLLATTLVTVRGTDQASGELADVTLNRALLDTLAQTTGGAVLAEYDAAKLPERLEGLSSSTVREEVTALWQSWPWFAAIVVLLAAELWLRRRLGML